MDFDPQAIRAFEHASWQRAAPRYGATFAATTAPYVGALLDAAQVGPGTRLLDLACGPGHLAASAAARGVRAAGLDFSSEMIALARAAHPAIEFVQGDADALPYPDDSFDAVVSSFGVHHFPHPAGALAEARRVLAPGDRMAFVTWVQPDQNIAWALIHGAIARHGVRAANTPRPGGSINTPEACLRLLEEAGFAEVRAERIRRDWPLRSARDLVYSMQQGTARMAALLAAQPPAALAAIEMDVAKAAEVYRDGETLRIPTGAILASGRKE